MPDRTYNNATGYEKAHPIFQFIKDSITNKWRPAESNDFKVNLSGDISIGQLNMNTDQLEGLSQSGNTYLKNIEQKLSEKDFFDVKYKELGQYVYDFTNLSYLYRSINISNGSFGAEQFAPIPQSSITLQGSNAMFLPSEVYESGSYLAKNVKFTSHQILLQTLDGSNFGNNDYFKLYQANSFSGAQLQNSVLLFSGSLSGLNGVNYFDTYQSKKLIFETNQSKQFGFNYYGTR